MPPPVTVIVLARNAAPTIAVALRSLQAQTLPCWQAMVVDDGSTDETSRLVATFSRTDTRIRTLRLDRRGASAARNCALSRTESRWVLFLDADDFVAPEYLDQMMAAVRRRPDADAAYCASVRVLDGGDTLSEVPGEAMDFRAELEFDAFGLLSVSCPLAIHSLLIRRAVVEAVGGFDEDLCSSEDWDLLTRIARVNGRFVGVRRLMAFRRLSPSTALRDPLGATLDARTVLARARFPDARLRRPAAQAPRGIPDLEFADFVVTLYFAAIAVGAGRSARPVLQSFGDWRGRIQRHGEAMLPVIESGLAVGAHVSHRGLAFHWPRLRPLMHEFFAIAAAAEERIELADPYLCRLDGYVQQAACARLSPFAHTRRVGFHGKLQRIGDFETAGLGKSVLPR